MLIKTKIEWTDCSFNPITGCDHGCWYCYAKKMFTRFNKSFRPTFHPERLNDCLKLKEPTKENNKHRKPWIAKAFPKNWLIFCCSVADLFASWTTDVWRSAVLNKIVDYSFSNPSLIFQLLTKQPEGAVTQVLPKNTWLGVTVTTQDELYKIGILKASHAYIKFVSFEPLLGEIDTEDFVSEKFDDYNCNLDGIDWIIIGKLTGSRKIKLQKEWVEKLIEQARNLGLPVFVKDNVHWRKIIREFPNYL